MPIANCFVDFDLQYALIADEGNGKRGEKLDIISAWAEKAKLPKAREHMTINFIQSHSQHGTAYPIMAWLYLPSLWPQEDVHSLQRALAETLSHFLHKELEDVHIITTIVDSGQAVVGGETQEW